MVLCLTSLVTAITAAKILGYDCGTAAGLLAGAFTESTVIGTAGEAIGRLPLGEAEKQQLLNNIPVAYAVSYLVGTGFVVWFLSNLAPRLLKVNLKEESRRLEAAMTGAPKEESTTRSAYREWAVRAFRVADGSGAGHSVGDYEAAHAPDRVFIERVRRVGEIFDAEPSVLLQEGDVVAVAARRHVLLAEKRRLRRRGP